jgi:hypothetical protein
MKHLAACAIAGWLAHLLGLSLLGDAKAADMVFKAPQANIAQTSGDAYFSGPWGTWGRCSEGDISVSLELRRDFNNFDTYGCPSVRNLAHNNGAVVSATFDELAHRTSASVDGVAALLFRRYFSGDTGILGIAIGPFIQSDGTEKYATGTSPSQSTDTFTAGGLAQVGFNNVFGWGEDNFRLRGGEMFGSAGTTSDTMIGEWIPFYGFAEDETRFAPLVYRMIPELMVQYDSFIKGPKTYALFVDNNSALRIGPQVQLRMWAQADPNTIWGKLLLTLLYHASDEVYTGRGFSWAQATLTYNLTTHVGLSASYGYGNSETTGNNTNQIKLGLAGKL